MSNPQRPQRFLFSSTSGAGHFHPLVPLARALRGVGHEVAFAGTDALASRVERAGFPFFGMGIRLSDDPEYQKLQAERSAMPTTQESELYVYPRLFGGIATRLRTPALVEIAQSYKPDMLIREGAEYAAVIAAEHLGIPHATVSFAAALKTMLVMEREAATFLDPLRAQWGLPPDPQLHALYKYLYLGYAPPGFALYDVGFGTMYAPLPDTTRLVQPQLFDASGDEDLPRWVPRLPDQPTVYVTLGTEVNSEPEFYPRVLQTLIEGVRDAPWNVIVTTGRDKDPADFGSQPPNVHIERYIPQTLLLRWCDAMVMHGGSNSILAAMDAALPVVVVPLIADQFFNAFVTERAGLGKVLELAPDGKDAATRALNPDNVRAAVRDVLENPFYKETADLLKKEINGMPGQEYAVELVEKVVKGEEV